MRDGQIGHQIELARLESAHAICTSVSTSYLPFEYIILSKLLDPLQGWYAKPSLFYLGDLILTSPTLPSPVHPCNHSMYDFCTGWTLHEKYSNPPKLTWSRARPQEILLVHFRQVSCTDSAPLALHGTWDVRSPRNSRIAPPRGSGSYMQHMWTNICAITHIGIYIYICIYTYSPNKRMREGVLTCLQ